jgi:ABC-type lipoprotein export system ATPase subunit
MLAELRNVTKTYRSLSSSDAVRILDGADFQLSAGETVAVVGPSGSGKSTLLNLLGALDAPDAGEVLVAGADLAKLDATGLAAFRNGTVGFIFQLHHLLPQCTVLENVLIPTLARKQEAPEGLRDRARRLLDAVGLGHRLDHRPGQISGGERQRAAVARALINQPRLLLADEPTGALDRDNAERLVELLAKLNEQEKVAIVMVTHASELASQMSRVLQLSGGKLVAA